MMGSQKSKETASIDSHTAEGSLTSTSRSTSSSLGKKISKSYNGDTTAVWVGRAVFMTGLVLIAVCLSVLAQHFLHTAEIELVASQWESKMERAILIKTIAKNKVLGAMALSKVVGYAEPDSNTWPFITATGYIDIASDIVPTSVVGGLSLTALVLPEQSAEFERHAYSLFNELFPDEELASNKTTSSFGGGIWAQDSDGNAYHDMSGESSWGSPYKFLTPKLIHSKGNHRLLMMNVHAYESQGLSIDAAYNCSLERARSQDPKAVPCGSISDIVPPRDPMDQRGPGAFLSVPVYPANDPLTVTGFIFAKQNWNEIFDSVFEDSTGIDIVISTSTLSFTYRIVDGEVQYIGEGNFHQDIECDLPHAVIEDLYDDSPMSPLSPGRYKIELYPNDDFYDLYMTNQPTVVAISCGLIIMMTAGLFVLYDVFVRREFNAKRELLHAKRQFVRFISHEVRSPLNAAMMGLTLLQEEMNKMLGCRVDDTESTSSQTTSPDEVASSASQVASSASQVASSASQEKTQDKIVMKRVLSWHRFAEEIQANTQSSVDVLNDLLNYDKVETGSLSLELTKIPIWELISKTAQEFKLPLAKKRINYDFDLPEYDRENRSVGDAVRLVQVLRNLISNAIKFTPEGGNITIKARFTPISDKEKRESFSFTLKNKEQVDYEKSGTLELEVKDSGAGMSKEQLSMLFRQGVQFNVNDLQAGQGSGLGLFIAKGIVEQHNGHLRAHSEGLNRGTAFTMVLPLFRIPETDSDMLASCHTDPTSYEQVPLKVLVVDDTVSNRRLLARLLQNRGHRVDCAEDGKVCVEMVQEAIRANDPYDLILLDYEMPVMNGPRAAKELRSLGIDAFIVGVTGNALAEDVSYFQECGANAVLPKPFSLPALEEMCMEYGIQGH